jgi:hypothetical protein
VSANSAYHVRLVSISAACDQTGLKRTRLMTLVDRGEVASVTLLDRRLIVASALQAFIARQRERAAGDGRVRMPPQ